MERKIGDKFICAGVMLEVVSCHFCNDCWLYPHKNIRGFSVICCIEKYGEITGRCDGGDREDGKSVIFKKVSDIAVMHIDIMNG